MTRVMPLIHARFQKELGWEPGLPFEEFEKTVKWYLDNKEWLENVTCCGLSEVL